MKKLIKKSAVGLMIAVQIALVVVPLVGYGMCVYKFVKCDFSDKTSYKAEALYGVGVFTGLGCIIGYIDLGE